MSLDLNAVYMYFALILPRFSGWTIINMLQVGRFPFEFLITGFSSYLYPAWLRGGKQSTIPLRDHQMLSTCHIIYHLSLHPTVILPCLVHMENWLYSSCYGQFVDHIKLFLFLEMDYVCQVFLNKSFLFLFLDFFNTKSISEVHFIHLM